MMKLFAKSVKGPDTSPLVARPRKKIGFIAALALVVGSAIGAGIFFKNRGILDSTQGSIPIAIGCWAVAAVGIIAIGLALLEIASSSRHNKGVLGWTELFTPRWFHSWAKGYMTIFYYPSTMVTLPLYAVQALSDATGHNFDWWQALLIAFAFVAWMMLVSAFSTRASFGVNFVMTVIKFAPIFLVPIFGFVSGSPAAGPDPEWSSRALTSFSPYLGILASLPAIFFAFDGFYTVASATEDLKRPKAMPYAMALGILIIVAAYLLISAGLFVSTRTGGVGDLDAPDAVKIIVNYGIFVAVLGIANGYAVSTHKSYDDMINTDDFVMSGRLRRWKLWVFTPGWLSFSATIVAWFALFAVLSAFTNYDGSGYGDAYGGIREAAMYSLADLITNWSSMAIFVILAFAIGGALANRRTKRVAVRTYRFFIPVAVFSLLVVGVATLYFGAEYVVGLFGVNGADSEGSFVYLAVLAGTALMGIVFNFRDAAVSVEPRFRVARTLSFLVAIVGLLLVCAGVWRWNVGGPDAVDWIVLVADGAALFFLPAAWLAFDSLIGRRGPRKPRAAVPSAQRPARAVGPGA